MDILKRPLSSLHFVRFPEIYMLIALFAGITFYAMSDYLFYTPDSARYVIWSNSIAQGDGFSDYSSPEPKRYVVHAPLYSFVLAPVAVLFTNNIIALKVATSLLSMILIFFIYNSMKQNGGRVSAIFGSTVLAFHPLTLLFSTQVLSEILFATMLIVLFGLFHQWSKTEFKNPKLMVGTIAALIGCVLSREIGIILLFVITIYLIAEKNYEQAAIVFLSVVIVYALWFFRNEVLVANRELPELRNMKLLGSHILTSNEQSMVYEFYMRIQINGMYYLKQMHSLLFYSQFSLSGTLEASMLPIVDRSSVWFITAQQYVSVLFIFLTGFPLMLLGYGVVNEFRNKSSFIMYLLFLLMYVALLLIYPVYDIRFVYPLLLIVTIVISSGFASIIQRGGKRVSVAMAIASFAVLLPNVLWGVSFANEAHEYQSDQLAYYNTLKQHPEKMTAFNKPFTKVAEWFQTQTDSSEVIISRWKELGILLPNKKIYLMDAFTSLTIFEQTIRDYGVTHIVTTRNDIGWHEYEFQLNASKKYSFLLVHTVADFDIFKVQDVSVQTPQVKQTQQVFQYLFSNLNNGRFDTLRSFFQRNMAIVETQPYLRFYNAVTMECLGELDSALYLYEELYRLPQGISVSQQIGFHQNVIDKRRSAERSVNRQERAALYLNIALNYWELDLKYLSFSYLEKTLRVDSTFIPAYSLSIYFSLLDQDTIGAVKKIKFVKKHFPDEQVAPIFSSIESRFDSLRRTTQNQKRSDLFTRLAEDFQMLGLSESALEAMRNAYLQDKENIELAMRLSELYVKKSKYFPALKVLEFTNARNPDQKLQQWINEIQKKY